jgi:hypothetical protein
MRAALLTLCIVSMTSVVRADEPRATNPIGYRWIVTSCESWSCASAALAAANGDPNTVVLPTSSSEYPWVILRRVVEGSIYVPPDEHFDVENFDGIADAAARFASIDDSRAPILVTTTASSKLVVSMKAPSKTRVVRH